MATFPRERLFVHPLLWTARHLSLLRCQFFDDGVITVPPVTPSSPADTMLADGGSADEPPGDTSLARALATSSRPGPKGYCLSTLVRELKCYRYQVDFYYARRAVAPLPCGPFSQPRESPLHPPPPAQLVYLDLSEIARYREIKVAGPGHVWATILPKTRLEDPYIAAVLIAIAQEQRLHGKGENKKSKKQDEIYPTDATTEATSASILSMMLITRPKDAKWLYIYTSKVPSAFLERLDHPSRPPAQASSGLEMAIYRRWLAFKPYETLSQRLVTVLRDARAGKYCASDGEPVQPSCRP
ncbi:hypothetical protein B0T22DRAFT_506369 [Podospora appendiculata]|uniref:Uncharacterized protein n=1 Tax=Podospora appendiculata TaxID=314037 RepID=A0AAE1CGW2_9PEZI|nr:hypothetical protein B0T22DRAFT_506369 [Podospora appendiculata]